MLTRWVMKLSVATILGLAFLVGNAVAQSGSIYHATLAEPNTKTQEVNTEQLRRILVDGSAMVVDTRSRAQYVAGHIPGARGLDGPPSAYVSVVERLVSGDKSKALVLYCNGPFCGASKQPADQLVDAGFVNVRRYQLGMPIWRALGGPTEIELEGIVRIFRADRTAVYLDARPASEFAKGSLPGAYNISAEKLKSFGLPVDDFNRRIVRLWTRCCTSARTCKRIQQEALAQRLVFSRDVRSSTGCRQHQIRSHVSGSGSLL